MFDQITSLDIVQSLNLLENLNVSHTSIDDDGLVAVVNHPSLASLNLLSTNVSDNGLHHLQGEEIMTFIVLIKLFFLLLLWIFSLYLSHYYCYLIEHDVSFEKILQT